MKEITFVCPTSKLTRTIKVCEIQKEIVNVIRKRRIFNDGSIFVLYNDGSYFFQLLGSDGHKAGQFKRCGIKAATASSFSGELFVFGDFAITPDGLVCIGEENIKKYGSYSGQYDFKPQADETDTGETDFNEMRQAYNEAIDNIEYNIRPIDKSGYSLCSISFGEVIFHVYDDGPYNYNVIFSEPEAAIRFALYLLGR